MATHSSILAWRIPWTEEPGRLQFMGSQSRTQLKRFSTHLCCEACGLLVPQPESKPLPSALEEWSLNHWITREVLPADFLKINFLYWKDFRFTKKL